MFPAQQEACVFHFDFYWLSLIIYHTKSCRMTRPVPRALLPKNIWQKPPVWGPFMMVWGGPEMVNRPNEMGAERGEEEKTKVHIMPSGQIFSRPVLPLNQ